MKKLTATLLASSLLGLAAYAQGTVNFANLGVGLNAPIYFNDGTTKVPSTGFTAELFEGPSATGAMTSVATTGFLSTAPGYFNGGVVTLAGVTAGTSAFFQVKVWQTASGSYANASAAGLLNTFGASSIFSNTTGGAGTPQGPPATLTGLTTFNLNPAIPEPSSLALAGLGAAALLAFRRRK